MGTSIPLPWILPARLGGSNTPRASGDPVPITRQRITVSLARSRPVPQWATEAAMGSWMARSSRGSGKNMVSVTVATVSTSIV